MPAVGSDGGYESLCYDRRDRLYPALMIMANVADTPTRTRLSKDVWLIAAGHGLTHWYTATFYILLPLIGREFGLSYTEIGFIMTIQHLAGAISNLPGGMIVDMVGKKGYLMAASLFWVRVTGETDIRSFSCPPLPQTAY